jgi:hypothetical protein
MYKIGEYATKYIGNGFYQTTKSYTLMAHCGNKLPKLKCFKLEELISEWWSETIPKK